MYFICLSADDTRHLVEALLAAPLVCLGTDGVLWQDLDPLRSMARTTQGLLEQRALLLADPPPDGSLPGALDLQDDALSAQVQQMSDESTRLVVEAGVHGCPL